MMDTDFFQFLFMHLEERNYKNISQNLKQDKEYGDVIEEGPELCSRFESLARSEEHQNAIKQ